MPRKKNTCMYLVAALLFLGGLGYLVFSGLSDWPEEIPLT